MSQPVFDRSQLRIMSLADRQHKMTVDDIYHLDSQTPPYSNPDLLHIANQIVKSHREERAVIWMMGAHVMRRGNSRFIIDLMNRGVLTHLATNGATAIHDFEIALIGATLENVEDYIQDGQFGHWQETGQKLNQSIIKAAEANLGYGEAIGKMILNNEQEVNFTYAELSIFANAYRLGLPITVHKGIGYDIIDQHPSANYSAMGQTSGTDFLRFVHSVTRLEGGVFLNLGSAVMGPEVYLKSLSMARNVAHQSGQEIRRFLTANFDLVSFDDFRDEGSPTQAHYYHRPKKTILVRTVKDGGESYHISGDFDRTIPALYREIIKVLNSE